MKGMILAVAGAAVLAASDATSKWLAASYEIGQIVFLRGLFAVPLVLILAHVAGGLRSLRIVNVRGQLLRTAFDAASTFLLVLGLALLPFVDVTIIMSAGPLFVAALAGIALREYVGWRRWGAICIGFLGMMMVVAPGEGASIRWAVLVPLAATLCGALRDLWSRRLLVTETAVGTLAVSTLGASLTGLLTLPAGWTVPLPPALGLMAVAGLLLAASQYLFIEAFRRCEATLVAPIKYTAILWATGIGMLVWGETPVTATYAGAALIVASGCYLMRAASQSPA